MDAIEAMARTWLRDVLARDTYALAFGAGMVIVGSLLTSCGTKLCGRGVWSVAKLGWSGLRWLTKPPPLGELAGVILTTMQKEQPTNPLGHTVWYGEKLHFFGSGIYVEHTQVNHLLRRAERRRIMRAVNFDRQWIDEKKIRDLAV